jgi:hypothetical protein
MRARLFAAVVVVLTALYCWALGWIAWGFLRAGGAIGWGLAIGIIALLVVTVWAVLREIVFGVQAARLARAYTPPVTDGDQGRSDPVRAEFEAARDAVGTDPDRVRDWQVWYRLGLAYDANHDRRHARQNIRRAIALQRRTRVS